MNHLFHEWATPATTLLTPVDPYFNEKLKPTEFNPEKSKKLLDEAGFPEKNGGRFSMKLRTTTNATRLLIAHSVADELKRVGIDVQVESMDWGKFKDDVEKGVAQSWILSWIGFKGPDIYKYAFATSSFPPNGANRGKFSNPELDHLLVEAKNETDFKKRKELYNQVQEIVLTELPYVFLWHEHNFAVLNQRVNGYEIFADGRLSSIPNVTFTKP